MQKFIHFILTSIQACLLIIAVLLVSGCSNFLEKDKVKTNSFWQPLKAEERKENVIAADNAVEIVSVPETLDQRFDVFADNVPAVAFFNSLVDGTKENIIIHPAVSGNISLTMKNVNLHDVLSASRDIYGYGFKRSDYGVQILPKSPQTRMFPINYLNVKRSGRSGMKVSNGSPVDVSSSSDSGSTSTTSSTNSSEVETFTGSEFWTELQQTLILISGQSENTQVVVDSHAGMVIVKAMPETMNQIQEYLQRSELIAQRQVLIEAKIVEVSLNDSFQAGISWDSLLYQGKTTNVLAEQGSNPLNIGDLGGLFSMNINSGDFNGALNLLAEQGDVNVLSNPRIATVNNQKAVIKVGSDEFFVTDIKSTTTATVTGTSDTPEIELTPFFSGIALDVTPQISADNEIILHIHPTVTDVEEKIKVIQLNDQEYSLPLALSSVRETDSIIRAKSGQIVIIGGLMQTKTRERIAKVPFLGDIPLLGYLFRQTRQETVQNELVILLQPKVIESAIDQAQIDNLNNRYQDMFY
ncbi:MAG: pilus (MSHA type) biogenesis protein MshL [Oleibacter sp.]|nr:pilus (MSHA type) biogenesis protein MshL [Thalassolituus sp.]